MSIEQGDVVDFVSIDNGSGHVFLSITDHLDWDQDEGAHLVLLQDKLNAYLRFIESGELNEKYPLAVGRKVTIIVAGKVSAEQTSQDLLSTSTGRH